MADVVNSLLAFTAVEDVVLKVMIALLILIGGHLGIKLLNAGIRKLWIKGRELTKHEIEDREETLQYLGYILDAGIIILSLLYLNAGLTAQISVEFASFLPRLLSVILIGLLGFIGINLFTRIGAEFLKAVGIENYFKEIGLSSSTLGLVTGLVKAFLYLLILQIALEQIGVGDTFINELVTASSWAAAFLIAGLIFYGFKDLIRNFAAGVYLQNSRLVRPGEEVRMEQETGEIRDISLFSTTVNTEAGYTVLKPNAAIMDSELRFKRAKNDIETLEDIKKYFLVDDGARSSAAAIELALDIFGYRNPKADIAEKADEIEGAEKARLIGAVEELTQKNVRGAFIEQLKIDGLENEFKAWFNNGALIIPSFHKPSIFPDAEQGEYVLAVGMEGDEVIAIDLGSRSSGVYFIDAEELQESMIDEDHGYIVLASKGTTAHWRIKNELIYSDKDDYEGLSKTLEARLTKILRQGRILTDVMPEAVTNYIEDWRTDRYASRLWKPAEDEKQGGENEGSEGN